QDLVSLHVGDVNRRIKTVENHADAAQLVQVRRLVTLLLPSFLFQGSASIPLSAFRRTSAPASQGWPPASSSGISAMMVVPAPGRLSTVKSPLKASTRSRMPSSPKERGRGAVTSKP